MEKEKMTVEQTVKEYLAEYGNTKESDLIRFLKNELGYSDRGIKKLLVRLEDNNLIFRVVHAKIRPPAVYYSVEEYIPLEIQKERIRAKAQFQAAEIAAYGAMER